MSISFLKIKRNFPDPCVYEQYSHCFLTAVHQDQLLPELKYQRLSKLLSSFSLLTSSAHRHVVQHRVCH